MEQTAGPMDAAAINAFLARAFFHENRPLVEAAGTDHAVCRMRFVETQIRPGGTLSGPTMMALADTAAYALVFSSVGFLPLAVTTNLSINFLRKPQPADLLAEARLLKKGKALLVCDVLIRSDGQAAPCAHAVVTYSLPPKATG